jgi:hypothetical protein
MPDDFGKLVNRSEGDARYAFLRAVETEPSLLGASPHLLAIARDN